MSLRLGRRVHQTLAWLASIAIIVSIGPSWLAALPQQTVTYAQSASSITTYYVTERHASAVARVDVDSAAHATVTPDYFPNLPGGQDSVVFDHEGHLIVSITELQTLAEIAPTTRTTVRQAINTTPIPSVADLALDPASDTMGHRVGWQHHRPR